MQAKWPNHNLAASKTLLPKAPAEKRTAQPQGALQRSPAPSVYCPSPAREVLQAKAQTRLVEADRLSGQQIAQLKPVPGAPDIRRATAFSRSHASAIRYLNAGLVRPVAQVRPGSAVGISQRILQPKTPGRFVPGARMGSAIQMWKGSRVLRPDQVKKVPGAWEIVFDRQQIAACIGNELSAVGKNTDEIKGLYSYLRSGGKAGFQGLTREPTFHQDAVQQIFDKKATSNEGGIVVMVDTDRVTSTILSLEEDSTRTRFTHQYGESKMYNKLALEGVAAVGGNIPVDAVTALTYIPPSPDPRQLYNTLKQLYGMINRLDFPELQELVDDISSLPLDNQYYPVGSGGLSVARNPDNPGHIFFG